MSEDDFYMFLHDNGEMEHQLRNNQYIKLSLVNLYNFNEDLALKFMSDPKTILDELSYESGKPVLITSLMKKLALREISGDHIGKPIEIEGVVVSISTPVNRLTKAIFQCPMCPTSHMVLQNSSELVTPSEACSCGFRRFNSSHLILEQCEFIDVQFLIIQEKPDELPPGEIPEPIKVTLFGELTRSIRAGDLIRLVGIVALFSDKSKDVDFTRAIDCIYVEPLNKDPESYELSESDLTIIKEISQRPNLDNVLLNSFAPSISGWNHIKESLMLGLFSGVRKEKGGLYTRGDIHILLVGDPGTAKTQFLQFASKASVRGVYSSGGGVSGVGLTAALTKNNDGQFVLSAGSMALADMGTACLDELDKMTKEDREKIHPALEQQIIPIDKGGLHATLNSRCAVFAACNPTEGTYVKDKTIPQNVKDFPPSLLSRFDLIYIMLDSANEKQDEAMVDKILGLENSPETVLSLETLRQYISYSKTINPKIPREALLRIKEYFLSKRQERKGNTNGIQITPRQVEALERMTEASARMHLRAEATMDDAERAIKLFEIYINETWTDPYTGEVDISGSMGIPSRSLKAQAEYLPRIMEDLADSDICEVDAIGRMFISRKSLLDRICENPDIDRYKANDIINYAEKADIIECPQKNQVRLPTW